MAVDYAGYLISKVDVVDYIIDPNFIVLEDPNTGATYTLKYEQTREQYFQYEYDWALSQGVDSGIAEEWAWGLISDEEMRKIIERNTLLN